MNGLRQSVELGLPTFPYPPCPGFEVILRSRVEPPAAGVRCHRAVAV